MLARRLLPRLASNGYTTRQLATPAFLRDFAEPERPIVRTDEVPGPESLKLLNELHPNQDERATVFFVDTDRSRGNYVADADGNLLLDMYCHIASIAVGYNNPDMLAIANSERMGRMLMNRPALGVLPPKDWPELVRNSFLKVAPEGMTSVFTAMCGTCANECAMKAACMYRSDRDQFGMDQALLESSCMANQPPGSPHYAVMSFSNAFHGRCFGALSTTRSKPIHKLGIPAFDWPAAPFPQLKYPLDVHTHANRLEEARCLDDARKLFKSYKMPIVAAIIEPIQGEGGDNHASPAYFRALQALCAEHEAAFIVDEVQTGMGATGRFWAHEHWDLPRSPDMVTFSKKMQAAGFFYADKYRPSKPFRNFNTWMGDPARALQLEGMLAYVDKHRLIDNTAAAGRVLLKGLNDLQFKYPHTFENARGVGTFAAIDCMSTDRRDKLIGALRRKGLSLAGCGVRTIRFRPMLTFTPQHAELALSIIDETVKSH